MQLGMKRGPLFHQRETLALLRISMSSGACAPLLRGMFAPRRLSRALSSNAEWRSGCVRAVGPGVGDNDRCRSFAELGCNPSSLVLCDPATIGCKLSSSR